MTTWVVVADSGRARIFEAARKLDELFELQGFVSSSHRGHAGGNPGGRGGQGGVHHGLAQSETLKEHDTAAAAHELAKFLQEAFNRHHFRTLVLIAAPDFLGELRKALDGQLQSLVMQSIAKDLTRLTAGELEECFRKT